MTHDTNFTKTIFNWVYITMCEIGILESFAKISILFNNSAITSVYDKPPKFYVQFIYLGRSISSTKNDVYKVTHRLQS